MNTNRFQPATHDNGNLGIQDTVTGKFVKPSGQPDTDPSYPEPDRDVRDGCAELNWS